jgi:hypothetical protein
MQAVEIEWSQSEEKIALSAFSKAYQREIDALLGEVRTKASSTVSIEDMWNLHDFLSARRHDLDGKYEYCQTGLIFTFAQLVKEGWLSLKDLDGLDAKKISKVAALASM